MAASTRKTKKNKETPNMKNKLKENKILLFYDILATSDCLCSASPAYKYYSATWSQQQEQQLQSPVDRLLEAGKNMFS